MLLDVALSGDGDLLRRELLRLDRRMQKDLSSGEPEIRAEDEIARRQEMALKLAKDRTEVTRKLTEHLHPSMIFRGRQSRDWEGNPLIDLPRLTTITVRLRANAAELSVLQKIANFMEERSVDSLSPFLSLTNCRSGKVNSKQLVAEVSAPYLPLGC